MPGAHEVPWVPREPKATAMTSVIISGARTPMGRLLGNLKNVPATTLGGYAIAAALERGGGSPEEVEYTSMGQGLQAAAAWRDTAALIDPGEGVRRDATPESRGGLRPAFATDGTITAGTASPISDGAAAVVVMSKAKAEELGLSWLGEIVAHGNVAGPDSSLQSQPANAIRHALGKAGLHVEDLDLIEMNEAFAQVVIHS